MHLPHRVFASVTLSLLAAPLAAQAAWMLVYPATSPPFGGLLVFDSARGAAILVGGSTSFWQWNGTNWTSAPFTPAPRSDQALAFDDARGRVVMFGGRLNSSSTATAETWEWNGSSWSLRAPVHSPPPRSAAAMAFDPTRGVTVLFGGLDVNGVVIGDQWEWNGVDWQQRASSGPAPRYIAALAFDPNTQTMLMFGGVLANGAPTNDTWLWDGSSWSQQFPTTPPYVRGGHAMATDAARRRVVMIGGSFANDPFAWEWDGSNWHPQFVASPSPRAGPGLAYDTVRRQIVLFGGGISGTGFTDTWLYRTPLPASFTPYGAGCPGSAGTPVLAPAPYSLPWLGDSFHTQVASLPQTAGGVFFLLGLGQTPPVSLAPLGLPGCDTWVTLDESVFVPVVAGNATRTFTVPNAAALAGLHVFEQAGVIDSAAPGGAALSNAGEIVLGIR